MLKIAIAFALLLWTVAAQANMSDARSVAAAPKADAYFSPSGRDSAGHVIGSDCAYATPCRTVEKALSFLAQNIARTGGAGAERARLQTAIRRRRRTFLISRIRRSTQPRTQSTPASPRPSMSIMALRQRGAADATSPEHGARSSFRMGPERRPASPMRSPAQRP